MSARFSEIVDAAAVQLGDVVLDGELVALCDGKLEFASLTTAVASAARWRSASIVGTERRMTSAASWRAR